MKGIIYARESSDDTEKAPPIENQIEIGRSWFTENKHELVKVYQDNGWSGGDWRRPAWNEVVAQAKSKQFEFVWAWSRTRLARDMEQHSWFYRKLAEAKIKIYVSDTSEFMEMETTGGYAKEGAFSLGNALFRIQTKEAVRKVYSHKLKKAREKQEGLENLKGQGLWGRTAIPLAIEQEAIRLKEANPKLTIREIALMLPTYQLKSKKNPTYRKPSYGWVATVLQKHVLKNVNSVKQSPPTTT